MISKNINNRIKADIVSRTFMIILALSIVLIFYLLIIMLIAKSEPVLSEIPLKDLIFGFKWNPDRNLFGIFPAIVGTAVLTSFSMLIAAPLSIFTAIYISEYLNPCPQNYVSSFINVLSGVPSVVFGVFALLYLVPGISVAAKQLFGISTTGLGIFSAGITLSVMVTPIIISLSVESIKSVPQELREVTLSLGLTKWQMIKITLLRAAGPGILSAVILGFGRAFGETMAVAMLIGNKNQIPDSLFSSSQTLPSLIVSSFGEMMSVPLQQSALIFVALTLFIIVTVTNIIAKRVNLKLSEKWKY